MSGRKRKRSDRIRLWRGGVKVRGAGADYDLKIAAANSGMEKVCGKLANALPGGGTNFWGEDPLFEKSMNTSHLMP